MAKEVEKLTDGFASLESFKLELSNVLKSLFDNQNIIKQEMFVIRNNQATSGSKPPEARYPEPVPDVHQPQNTDEPVNLPENTASGPPASGPGSASPPPTRGPKTPPPRKAQSPPKVTKSAHADAEAPKILYIGDSISANVDVGAIEVATQAKVIKAKAYSSIHDTVSNVAKQAAKFPDSNFTDVVPTELNKDKYQCLILQAGSVDITNLNTKDEPSKYTEYFKQETVKSVTNLFNAASNAL